MGAASEPNRPARSLRMQVAGGVLMVGGVLAWLGALLPPAASGSEALIVLSGAVVFVLGLALLLTRRRLPEPALGAVVALGTVMITLATYEGGGADSGTEDNEMLYLWVAFYAFYFLSLAHALAQTGVIAIAYGWLLTTESPTIGDGVTRWMVTMTTLVVGGLIVARLRGSVQKLVGELTDRARADSLTGVLNREGLEERAELELARSRRDRRPVSVLVADIDGFKKINDTLGHPAGDEVLKRVARIFDAETRAVDAVARVGGDEFTILLPGADEESARAVAERLRTAVREGSAWDQPLAISVGIAVGHGEPLEQLWLIADRAMYEAKRAGGDGVAASGRPAPTA